MRFFVAFFISLLIYLLLIWFFMTQFPKIETPPKKMNNHVIKIDIRDIPIPKQVVVPPAPMVQAVPVKKKTIKKKVVVKKKLKPKKKVVKKKVVKKKVVKKELEEMVYIEEPFITQPIEVQENSDDLASFLGASTPKVSTTKSYPNSKIKKLYGSSFHTFTPTQKEFIENNLNTIQRITQNLLTRRGYPEGAGRNRQEGTNVVSFNLHPNGDISGLRLKQRIGSRPLDDNTLSLIRSAYKDYPYPSTTTQIVFYVTYSIYGY